MNDDLNPINRAFCPYCGSAIAPGQAVCDKCQAKLTDTIAPAAPAAPAPQAAPVAPNAQVYRNAAPQPQPQYSPNAQAGKKKSKKLPIIIIIAAVVAAAIAVGAIFLVPSIIRSKKYDNALSLMNKGEYLKANEEFLALKGYKDSADKANEALYLNAVELMEDGSYEEAIEIFTDLDDYSDSEEMVNEAKYLYVNANLDKNNKTTLKYLEALVKEGYKDAEKIYSDLLAWKITPVCLNTDQNDEETILTAVSKYCDFLHCAFEATGGKPEEKLSLRIEYLLPDGSTEVEKTIDGVEDGAKLDFTRERAFFSDAGAAKAGAMQIRFINDETDEEVGSISVDLTDEDFFRLSILYCNDKPNDSSTVMDEISRYCTYYRFGYKISNNDSDEEAKIVLRTVYPNGKTEETTETVKFNESLAFEWLKGLADDGSVSAGTLKVEFCNKDTGTVIGSFRTTVTDTKPAPGKFAGKVAGFYANTSGSDFETKLQSLSAAETIHIGITIKNAEPGAKINYHYLITFPDGSTEPGASDTMVNSDGSISFGRIWSDGITDKGSGTLTITFYDHVSYELLGTASVEIDDRSEFDIKILYYNDTPNDVSTKASEISTYCTYFAVGYRIETDEPIDEIELTVRTVYPNGKSDDLTSTIDVNVDAVYRWTRGLVNDPDASAGAMKLEFYEKKTGLLIGTFTINVNDTKPAPGKFAGKVTGFYANADSGDFETKLPSLKMSGTISIGLIIEGAEPGSTLNYQYSIRYPDGSSGVGTGDATMDNNGFDAFGRIWENGISGTEGTLTVTFYDLDSYEELGTATVQLVG